MTESEYERRLAEARVRVAKMDVVDGGEPTQNLARTAKFAIGAGLLSNDQNCLFEAVVYLERLTRTA